MAVGTKPARGPKQGDQSLRLLPISDTVNGSRAREVPADVLAHYECLLGRLWLPPQLDAFGKAVFDGIGGGRTTWASLTGPYGFGKTAAGILLWHQAREAGFLGELLRGFTGTNTGVFDTPEAALDFDVLRERFQRGEVVIRIEPRQ